jgi:hypothetical protein
MISALQNNNPPFTSVIPVRVFIDGMETFDNKLIQKSCNQLSHQLVGKGKRTHIMEKFNQKDPHYQVLNGKFIEPARPFTTRKAQPSDFFACIIEKGKAYYLTGQQALKLREAGHSVGLAKRECNERGVNTSFDLMVAKRNYGTMITDFIKSARLRLGENIGNKKIPLTLNISMKSNGKYKPKDMKIQLDDINFTA